MSTFEGLAEGTPVWLPDGVVAPVERVATEKLAVLAFDKEWDLRDAARHGCQVRVDDNGTWLRVRLTDPEWHRNALRDLLATHQVWGLKGEEKRVADLPYSRAFVCGLVAGLFDSDGSVGARQIEFANISESLVRQLGDALLRLGIQSHISSKRNNHSMKPLWRLRVADGRSVVRLSETVRLRTEYKAAALAALAARGRASRRSATGPRGYADGIMWDRVVSVSAVGVRKVYSVEAPPSRLWIANGVVTGPSVIPSTGVEALTCTRTRL